MNIPITELLIAAGTLIVIPWVTWVSVAIFTLRQENAVMKMEMGLMRQIGEWMRSQGMIKN